MNQNDYRPRRAEGKKHRHPIRAVIIVLIIMAALAICIPRLRRDPARRDAQQVDAARSAQQEEDSGAASAALEPSPAASGSGSAVETSGSGTSDRSAVEAGTSSPADASTPTGGSADGIDLLMLVNSTHSLPEGYHAELKTLDNGQQIAELIYPDLQQMFDDARSQGVYPIVASGYRTAEKQQSLMDEKVKSFEEQGYSESDARREALKWVNAVGYSEHQIGLAVDINADGVHSAGYQVYNWLADNAWQYGFILRYPEDKTDITGTGYEPWHYRYVGRDAAREIHTQGVCLEEYLNAVD